MQALIGSKGAPPLTASAAPTTQVASGSTSTITTGTSTATPTGGVGPFTYFWSYISYDSGTAPNFTAGTSATTAFSQSGMTPGASNNATAVCTITDTSNSQTTTTNSVTINWSHL